MGLFDFVPFAVVGGLMLYLGYTFWNELGLVTGFTITAWEAIAVLMALGVALLIVRPLIMPMIQPQAPQ